MKNLCNRHSIGLCAAIKISEVISSEKWMELEIIMLNQVSQTQEGNHYMFSLSCGSQLLSLKYVFRADMCHEAKMRTMSGEKMSREGRGR